MEGSAEFHEAVKKEQGDRLFLAGLFGLCALACVAGFAFFAFQTYQFQRQSFYVDATVVQLLREEHRLSGSTPRTVFRPQLSYIARDGTEQIGNFEFVTSNARRYRVGQVLGVRYSLHDPDTLKLNDTYSIWAKTIYSGLTAAFFITVAASMFRMRRLSPKVLGYLRNKYP